MKIGKAKRYNPDKKGSFDIGVRVFDWQLSITIGALRYYLENKEIPKGTKTFVKKLIKGYGKALSKLLKIEMNDLKNQKEIFEYILRCPLCKKKFKKISPYVYAPSCEHLSIRVSVG